MSKAKSKSRAIDLTSDKRCQNMQRHLKLQGKAPATSQSYCRALREAIKFFGDRVDSLSREDLGDYFNARLNSHSSATVTIDVSALKFYTVHVLNAPWAGDKLFKNPRSQRLPDIVTVEEIQQIIDNTRCLSYRVYFFTLYSMGLRLSEGLQLRAADIDAKRGRVHVRQSKNRKDRLVPLPQVTLQLLREFWCVHRNPHLLFPNRAGGLSCSAVTKKPLDSSGVQKALRRVCEEMGLKKALPLTVCVTATRPI